MRPADEDDLPALRRIYAAAVTSIGPADYTAKQVAVWRAFADAPEFSEFVLAVDSYVAEVGSDTVGFCGVSKAGHVASLYVDPVHTSRGIATQLLEWVLARHPAPTSGRYFAEASRFSRRVFERCGFREFGRDRIVRGGVEFERILLERPVRRP